MLDEILTLDDVASILKTTPSSIYGMTRSRARVRHKHPLPVLRLACGLRFRKSDIEQWLESMAKENQ